MLLFSSLLFFTFYTDLKPENLGLSGDGTLKLFDFGLCRCVQKRSNETDTYEMTGYTGSLRYMAPEVVLSRPYNEKVDVFSYAIVVWTIARNKPPFRGFDREMHRNRVVQGGERPKLEKGWPADFSNLLSECWHQDSSKRPSFADVSARLGAMVKATAGGGSGAASGGGGAASQSAATASSTSTGTSSAGFGGFMRKMIGK
jgi:serine/threonine protein kinase